MSFIESVMPEAEVNAKVEAGGALLASWGITSLDDVMDEVA